MKPEIDYQNTNRFLISSGVAILFADMFFILVVNVDLSTDWKYWVWIIFNGFFILLSCGLIRYGYIQMRKNEELEEKMKKERHEIDQKLKALELEEKSRAMNFRKEHNIISLK